MEKTIRLYDRSRTTADWSCPRLRYYQYEYDGKGIVPANDAIAPFLGLTVHDALAAFALITKTPNPEITPDLICETARKQVFDAFMSNSGNTQEELDYAYEQSTLIDGMLRGFYKYVWPQITENYPEVVAIEQELTFYHDSRGLGVEPEKAKFCYMSKPDLVLRDKEGRLVYLEYKTTSSKKENWTNFWNTAVQLHSTLRAIEQTLGEKPVGVVVQGLYKGYVSYGKQSSPFCYAYSRGGNPPFTSPEVRYEYAAGFRRTPVWHLDGGVARWVNNMPNNVLSNQFPCTPLIFINDDLVDGYFAQRAIRESEMEMGKFMIESAVNKDEMFPNYLNAMFPQKFDQCNAYYGKPCMYRNLCFGGISEPLNHGYEYRQPHHVLEMEEQG